MSPQDHDYIITRGSDGYYVKQQIGTERIPIEEPIKSKDPAVNRAKDHAAESDSHVWFERATGELESIDCS